MITSGQKKARRRAVKALHFIAALCEGLGVAVLFGMMGIIGVDVIARYLFNSPISGAYELIEIMLALLVFLALPASLRFNSHITVDLVDGIRSVLFNRLSGLIVSVSSLAIFAVLTVELYVHASKLKSYGQVTNSLEIPLYLVGFLATFCCFICVLIILRGFVSSWRSKP